MVKTLENNKRTKTFTKSRDLSESHIVQSNIQKSKLEWANDVAKNADLEKIRLLL
jgi:hypothetical protein